MTIVISILLLFSSRRGTFGISPSSSWRWVSASSSHLACATGAHHTSTPSWGSSRLCRTVRMTSTPSWGALRQRQGHAQHRHSVVKSSHLRHECTHHQHAVLEHIGRLATHRENLIEPAMVGLPLRQFVDPRGLIRALMRITGAGLRLATRRSERAVLRAFLLHRLVGFAVNQSQSNLWPCPRVTRTGADEDTWRQYQPCEARDDCCCEQQRRCGVTPL